MSHWDIHYLEYAVRTILYLLRHRLMSARDYDEMRRVFLDEPSRLYTIDIQSAFVHLLIKNEDSKSIATINRRSHPLKPIIWNKYPTNSGMIGIKDISLSLIMPVVCNTVRGKPVEIDWMDLEKRSSI